MIPPLFWNCCLMSSLSVSSYLDCVKQNLIVPIHLLITIHDFVDCYLIFHLLHLSKLKTGLFNLSSYGRFLFLWLLFFILLCTVLFSRPEMKAIVEMWELRDFNSDTMKFFALCSFLSNFCCNANVEDFVYYSNSVKCSFKMNIVPWGGNGRCLYCYHWSPVYHTMAFSLGGNKQ